MTKKISLCESCGAINKVSLDKARTLVAYCGRCQRKLSISSRPSSIDDSKLDKIVNHSDLPVLVDIYADWCGPCKAYTPIFEKTAHENWNKAEFYKVDSEKNPSLSRKYNIRGIPCTLIFNNGTLITSQSGLLDQNHLESIIARIKK